MTEEKRVAVIGNVPGIKYLSQLTDEEIAHLASIPRTEVSKPYVLTEMPDPGIYDLTKKQRNQVVEPVRTEAKVGRNKPCPCWSGKKYKNCCIK